MTASNNIVNLPMHMRAATIRTDSVGNDDNTVDIIFTTGADVLRCDPWDGTYIERLETGSENVDLDRLNAGAPLLDTHNSGELSSVIGAVVRGSAKMVDGQGICKVKLSKSARAADTVADILAGIINNISVGYEVTEMVRTEATVDSPTVMVATRWTPVEVSAVPVPADFGAQFQLAVRASSGVKLNQCTIVREKEPTVADKTENDTKEMKRDDAVENTNDDTSTTKKEVREDDSNKEERAADKEDDTKDKDSTKEADKVSKREFRKSVERGVAEALASDRKRQADIMTVAKMFDRFGFEDAAIEACREGTSEVAFRAHVLQTIAPIVNKGGPSVSAAITEPSLAAPKERDMDFARNFFGTNKK